MNSTTKNLIKILIVLLVSGSTFLLPFEAWGVPINPIQARVVALFVMAALMWILEPIPIWTTSVLVITIALLCLSSGAFSFARPTVYDAKALGKIVKTAAAPGLEPAVMDDVMTDVKKRLSKKSNLDANEIYTSVDYVLLNHSDKAKKAAVKASRELSEAVMNEAGAALSAPVAEALRLRLAAKPILSKTEVDTSIAYVVDEVAKAAPDQQAALQAAAMGLQSKVNAMDTAALDKAADKYAKLEATCNAFESDATREQLKKMPIVNVIQAKNAMATFADPIIILFLGGFFLAAAATKYRLDINLARWLIKPFGTKPANVLLGLMVVTALFSMFMSNTATAAMMLAILAPVLSLFAPEDRGRAAFALCIPVAANIGGIGTPIGTPPNAIALKAMADMGLSVDFGKWMVFGVPFVIVMLLIAWALLRVMFPIQQKELKLEMGGKFLKTPKAIVVYVTFVVSVLLWVFGGSVGLDSNTVAIIPIAVFSATQVITKDDLKKMSWDVLWLVAGGFALGLALQETNLAKDMINAIPFASWDPMLLMVGVGFICLFMATFMSHTATASLLMPIMGAVAGSMISAGAMDSPGAIGLLVAVAFCSSLGMALPISTPPNALAYATGLVESKGMAISGTILCLIGVVLTFLLMHFLAAVHFFG
ncbi:MAG: SLC13 family permease [Akkermansia muciniphila]|nr:SLC13 family permease [Akkermansia muciniphila]